MRAKLVALAIVVLATICRPPPAAADITPVGDGTVTGSWSQQFVMNNAGTGSSWDSFQVNIIGAVFEQGIQNISDSAWKWTACNDCSVEMAAGPLRTNNLYFTLQFLPSMNVPFTLNFFQFQAGKLLAGESTSLIWNGKQWSEGSAPTYVPEPNGLALLSCGLLGIGVLLGAKGKTK
jgi:hypothetical protein